MYNKYLNIYICIVEITFEMISNSSGAASKLALASGV